MDINKNELRRQFTKDWKKHYNVKILKEYGFHRQQCKKCKRWFWAPEERKFCADASCIGYEFIGNSPCKNKLEYVECWKKIEKYFVKKGHTSVKPYPTVARWRDDLYFTVASINDFQPYVVSGELPPPANPLIVPQPCIRFPDISNVGVSGRHYTNFVMIGQHAFNSKNKLFYWKDEALKHDIEFMKVLGIPTEELVFIEDVWAGGGNFGPCIEYFVKGLELGNCVFMQYEVVGGETRELETKVIDMGAGLERFPWITQGTPTSYGITFRETIEKMKKMTGVTVNEKAYLEYAKLSGGLNADERDLEKEKKRIEKKIGKKFVQSLKPLQALYAAADHTLTLLFTSTDGMLPSNAGGGYNLRMILRRVFGFEEEFGFKLDFGKIIESHAHERRDLFPHLQQGVNTTIEVIEEERKKYEKTKEKAKGKVTSLIKGGKIEKEDFVLLYKSHGVPPEAIIEEAKKQNVNTKIPKGFYDYVQEGEGKKEKNEGKEIDVKGFPKTKILYYDEKGKFKGKVLGILKGKYLVLDKTAFYPEGGGQAADSGTIDEEKVGEVIGEKGVILHEISNPKKFRKGMKIEGKVNLKRRKIITRHHTATHLLNAACKEVLGSHVWQGGSHKDEEKAHLDVTHYKKISEEELKKIELKVNEYIAENIPIEIEILSRNKAEEKYGFTLYQGGAVPGKELRIVKIGNVDAEACGGTHHMLKSTGEIGCFKITKRESVQDGIERIEYKCGTVAIKYVQERERLLKEASGIISVSEEDLPKTVERFFEEWKKQKKEIEKLKSTIAESEAERILSKGKEINFVDYDEGTMKQIISRISKKAESAVALLNKEGIVMCVCKSGGKKGASELLNEITKKYGGSGGGSKQIAFGKIKKISFKK